MKVKKWSRKKIVDEFTGTLKADGAPMSRQQIHMPAIGVYCLKHTIAARERMRKKLKYRRRLHNSASYILEKESLSRSKKRATGRVSLGRLGRAKSRASAKTA